MGSSANATAFYNSLIGANPEQYQTDYYPAGATEDFHALPRFSRSDDFSLLFSGDTSRQEKYGLGLLFVGCLIVSFFIVWGFLISLFKCIGPRWLGVFSGHPYERDGCYSTTGRVIYGTSTLLVLIFAILAVIKGVTDLDFTTDTIDATNQDAMKIRANLIEISDNLQLVSRQATPVRDQLVVFLKTDICPLNPNSSLENNVRGFGKSTLDSMEALDNFINNELRDLDYALYQAHKANQRIDSALEKTKFTGAASIAILLPYIVVPCIFLVGLTLGWCGYYSICFYFMLQWIVLPLFILMVIFGALVTGFSASTLEGNADFCSGGPGNTPEGTIQNILIQHEISPDAFYHKIVTFYSNQCRTDEDPWAFLQVYHQQLATAKSNLDGFTATINAASTAQVSQECGVDFGPTLQLMNQLDTYTSILLDSAGRSLNLMSCKNIVPLYTAAVHEGVCKHSVRGTAWVFASFFVMTFFGMMMLMFRGAYYPIYSEYDDDKSIGYTSSDEDRVQMGPSEEEYTTTFDENDNKMRNEAPFQDDDATGMYGLESFSIADK